VSLQNFAVYDGGLMPAKIDLDSSSDSALEMTSLMDVMPEPEPVRVRLKSVRWANQGQAGEQVGLYQ
jgi:hypothetical protein